MPAGPGAVISGLCWAAQARPCRRLPLLGVAHGRPLFGVRMCAGIPPGGGPLDSSCSAHSTNCTASRRLTITTLLQGNPFLAPSPATSPRRAGAWLAQGLERGVRLAGPSGWRRPLTVRALGPAAQTCTGGVGQLHWRRLWSRKVSGQSVYGCLVSRMLLRRRWEGSACPPTCGPATGGRAALSQPFTAAHPPLTLPQQLLAARQLERALQRRSVHGGCARLPA